jgi:hypothetical protein
MRIWIAVGPLVLGALVAGCWRSPATPSSTIGNTSKGPAGLLTITSTGFGPIDAKEAATLANMRKRFVGFDVRPVNDPNLEIHIYRGTEQLAFVVLNDDMTVFNVHATSGKVAVADRPWRVGAPFQGASELTTCECWGDNPTCFKTGEHIAVNFKRGCDGVTSGEHRALRALDGLIVQRVIWSPNAFGVEPAQQTGEFGGDPYGGGGDPCGGVGDPCGGP